MHLREQGQTLVFTAIFEKVKEWRQCNKCQTGVFLTPIWILIFAKLSILTLSKKKRSLSFWEQNILSYSKTCCCKLLTRQKQIYDNLLEVVHLFTHSTPHVLNFGVHSQTFSSLLLDIEATTRSFKLIMKPSQFNTNAAIWTITI